MRAQGGWERGQAGQGWAAPAQRGRCGGNRACCRPLSHRQQADSAHLYAAPEAVAARAVLHALEEVPHAAANSAHACSGAQHGCKPSAQRAVVGVLAATGREQATPNSPGPAQVSDCSAHSRPPAAPPNAPKAPPMSSRILRACRGGRKVRRGSPNSLLVLKPKLRTRIPAQAAQLRASPHSQAL